MSENGRKVIVFADLQNVSPKSIPAVVRHLAPAWHPVVRAYGEVSKRHRRLFEGNGISFVEMISKRPGHNAVDIQIAADVMEELYTGNSEALAIIGADSDYTYVVRRIRECKPVFVFGVPGTPHDLKEACTCFYLLQPMEGNQAEWRVVGVEPGRENSTSCTPRVSEEIRRLVEEFISNTEERTIDVFSAFVRHRQPDFTPRKFGCSSISRLLRKFAVCELRPLRNAGGFTVSYELVLANLRVTNCE
jgi:uncharacterized LabA/DUF88 family protein